MTSWWHRLTKPSEIDQAVPMGGTLEVVSAGLCTALGYDLAASGPALMAGLDAFRSEAFVTDSGVAIPVASLAEPSLWGNARLARWMTLAISDCLARASLVGAQGGGTSFDPRRCAVLVLAPDPETLMQQERDLPAVMEKVLAELGMAFSPLSQVLPLGRAGLATALEKARELTQSGHLDHVLLASADSLLDAGLIEQFIDDERLLFAGQRDGFIPGEAAAAVLFRGLPEKRQGPAGALLISGWAQASEAARWDNEVPNRAVGLTRALRQALAQAKLQPQDLKFRVADQNGEAFYAREAANAFTRLMANPEAAKQSLELITLADKVGELGCATGVAALSLLHYAMAHPVFSPGDCGVLHQSQDNGGRCAIVVQRI